MAISQKDNERAEHAAHEVLAEIFEEKLGTSFDQPTRQGRMVIYHIGCICAKALDKAGGPAAPSRIDAPDGFPAGHTLLSWLHGLCARLRKAENKLLPPKEEREKHRMGY